MSRNYQPPDQAEAERRRAEFIQARRSAPGVTCERSDVRHDGQRCHGSGDSHSSAWGSGFRPRERREVVRNCAALPRDLVEGVVLRVAASLLGMTGDEGGGVTDGWSGGGKAPNQSLSIFSLLLPR